jgi:thiol oxidase
MKSLFINEYIVDFHRYFILLIMINIVRQISSAVLPSRDSVSLYNANDKITILTGENFSSIVYQSKTAWLIEFYASWCGHCQSYANVGFIFNFSF